MLPSTHTGNQQMEIEEKVELLRGLQPYGNMYYTFLNMSHIEFSDTIKTLAVCASEQSSESITLKINKNFWESIDKLQKLFLIGHECLHVMLSHLPRLFMMSNHPNFDMLTMNIAADLCVNETLTRNYKFIREEVDIGWWWLDKAFPNQQVSHGMSMEYYYDLLLEHGIPTANDTGDNESIGNNSSNGNYRELADDHSEWFQISDNVLKEIIDSMDLSELEKLKQIIIDTNSNDQSTPAGNSYELVMKQLQIKNIVKKKKWESVIHRWVKSKLRVVDSEHYQWARKNRRFTTIDNKFFLPTIADMDKHKKDKISIAFYLDTSGSCYSYAQRFFDAAKSVPLDKFDVRFFCFSTYVTEIDLTHGKLAMGGGTSFRIIEESVLKHFTTYPDGVFIITDGYGDNVVPKIPEKWFWFLTEDVDSCFPKTCNKFLLKNYE